MKFIPILFSTPMVQAIIEGRKTMTRRVMKPSLIESDNCFHWNRWINQPFNNPECSPYGKVGDVLWVRETFVDVVVSDGKEVFIYKADDDFYKDTIINWKGWKPSLFMPKAACRIFLKITEIRVERLQDITNEDSLKEGIEIGETVKSPLSDNNLQTYKNYLSDEFKWYAPKLSFNTLWKSINGKDSWEANPWVWVICFERIEKPTGLKYFFFRN